MFLGHSTLLCYKTLHYFCSSKIRPWYLGASFLMFEPVKSVSLIECCYDHPVALYPVSALQSTAVLSLRPDHAERPLSCSLQSLEVFSCSLSAEDETALSIIDPMIITMELNSCPVRKEKTFGPSGLLDATSKDQKPPILEVGCGIMVLKCLKGTGGYRCACTKKKS